MKPASSPTARGFPRINLSRPRLRHAFVWIFLPAIAVVSFMVKSAGVLPPATNLSTTPLYSAGTRDKPTLSLALSVEFPTVGAQYTPGGMRDATYNPATEYLGYFDSESCYLYNNEALATMRRFDRSGVATNRGCNGTGFSGNFLNWSTSSAIDVLRLGLTGGDRIVDTGSLTVLQRAVLPTNFWNSSNFPAKLLLSSLAGNAVPNNLRGTFTGDIWVANCLNRVHFGSENTGSCDAPGNNSNLGIASAINTNGPVTNFTGSLPSGFSNTSCAGEKDICNFNGTMQVAYGALLNWKFSSANNSTPCTNEVFGDPLPLIVKKCFIRPDPTGWSPFTPGAFQSAVLSADKFFYSRVRVCESDSLNTLQDPRTAALADRQRALCAKYPNGNFKPVGQLQKNSDNVRVAAFGYLMDNTTARYGGVLRAPMKYVGGNTYDATGSLISGGNPKIEWNENSGVFAINPETAAEGSSGVINYLNQFGRTGNTPGTYKTYDPVNELYYEALRYVQGLPPTPQATIGMTTAMKDGFPVYTDWKDPHAGGSNAQNYSCIRNNILLIGDVNSHYDKSIPGNINNISNEFARPANLAANEPDFNFWTKVVGGFESNNGVSYLDGKGTARITSNPNSMLNSARWGMENQNISNNSSYQMAGMAYWGNTHDIRGTDWADTAKRRPGMRLNTYILDVNEKGEQIDQYNRRNNNQFFLAAKYGGFADKSEIGNLFIDKNKNLDNTSWQRSSEPGEANNYFLSDRARTVLQSLESIFEAIAKKGNSIAGNATSGQRLNVDNYIYQAQFDPAAWSGDISSTPVNVDPLTKAVSLASAPQWSASTELDKKEMSARKIFIGKAATSSGSAATPFIWNDIEANLKESLNKGSPTASLDMRGEARLNYLRGDRTLETSTTQATLRRRSSRLGDIINSGVVLSDAPTQVFSTSNYAAFYEANKSRVKALFVGANDGMLHAFSAKTGEELFAYIPSWMGPKLSALTNDNYVTNHQSYVDATPTVSEAQVGSVWRSVLVGGTGAGGQGVYALDITDPSNFNASKVMWEFTDSDDVDMGNVIGKPQIRKFRVSALSTTSTPVTLQEKWFAVVASGVNNYVSDGHQSTSGRPAIFLLDLAKPSGSAWIEGNNYFKVVLPIDPALSASRATGVTNFSIIEGGNGAVKYLYAGDLHGRMWKLDFAKISGAASIANWTIDRLSVFTKSSLAQPLFLATDAAGVPQPITAAPNLPVGPTGSTLVVFGTGKYLEASDNVVNANTQVQSLYAIYDNGDTVNDSSPAGSSAVNGRGRLATGSISNGVVKLPAFTFGRAKKNDDITQRSGWYIDLATGGERYINSGELAGTSFIFGSVIPPSSATQACGTGGGNTYSLNVFSGNGLSLASTVGIPGAPLIFEVGMGTKTLSDSTGRITKTSIRQIIVPGSSGVSVAGTFNTTANLGRLSWRQINGYQEIRNSP